eukprot:GHVH01000375.1.p1 GENE.GHVH01000375.1~~GHVH01000375.1.p1  ORF type:complete len:288 (-),score=12.13 GHVH01000375.1:701-1486(-)
MKEIKSSNVQVCRHWLKGKCRLGIDCHFSHINEPTMRLDPGICRYYGLGHCSRGSDCAYEHLELFMSREKIRQAATEVSMKHTGEQNPTTVSRNSTNSTTIPTSFDRRTPNRTSKGDQPSPWKRSPTASDPIADSLASTPIPSTQATKPYNSSPRPSAPLNIEPKQADTGSQWVGAGPSIPTIPVQPYVQEIHSQPAENQSILTQPLATSNYILNHQVNPHRNINQVQGSMSYVDTMTQVNQQSPVDLSYSMAEEHPVYTA